MRAASNLVLWQRLLIVAVLVATLPLVVAYLAWIWRWPHYQFYPVVLACVGIFGWSRWKEYFSTRSEDRPRFSDEVRPSSVSFGLIWSGLVLEIIAIVAFSPWLGFVAFWLVGLGLLWMLPRPLFRSLGVVWCLLLLLVRLPLNYDQVLIQTLQFKTAELSGLVLDLLKIEQLREGVLIQLPTRTLFVEEACSGVQSLFSLIALAAIMAVGLKRPGFHSLLLLLAAIFGAAAMNIVRTVSIVLAFDVWNVDLLSEPAHTFFGLAVFVVSLIWLVCCDQCLSFWLAEIPIGARRSGADSLVIKWWNYWLSGKSTQNSSSAEQPVSPIPAVTNPRPRMTAVTGFVSCMIGLAAFTVLLVNRNTAVATIVHGIPPSQQKVIDQLLTLDRESLPPQLQGWALLGFQRVERSPGDQFGDYSLIWTYQSPYGPAAFSVDFPFLDWHDLRTCYINSGWQLIDTGTYSSPGAAEHNRIEAAFINTSEHSFSYLAFALTNFGFDNKPVNAFSTPVWSRLGRMQSSNIGITDPLLQFQVFLSGSQKISPEERREIRKHLELFQQQIINHVTQAGG